MLKDHPKGIMVMFTTEMWERFGFYIMMAILVLYMESEFNGMTPVKGLHYGVFLVLVYLIPLLGGYLAIKLLGR
jgi:POT family proton-dependent oligopeptide transporter